MGLVDAAKVIVCAVIKVRRVKSMLRVLLVMTMVSDDGESVVGEVAGEGVMVKRISWTMMGGESRDIYTRCSSLPRRLPASLPKDTSHSTSGKESLSTRHPIRLPHCEGLGGV